MKTRLLGGIAALLVAIIGTVLLITYVQSADQRAMAGTETTEVYVVQKAIPAGTPGSELGDSIAKKPLPKSTLTEGTVTNVEDLGTKVTAVSLVPGEQLLNSRMVDADSFLGPSRVAVPDGMQEISIKLPIERVVGGKITAGDTVGIFISLQETSTNGSGDTSTQSAGTQLTFHKVLVTAAQFSNGTAAQPDAAQGNQSEGSLNSDKNSQSDGTYLITVARNSVEAERLVYAVEFGKIYLSKEPAEASEGNTGVVDKTKVFR
ncbi:RcpC/CpaB family pilus assembly protein [Pseudarthrobacter sp. MDT3-26]|uniref:Flp pilus assembly protein CpaB n=1 Tax=Pseudarthrobacter raffinosi TaxID=2953651 RepID=UPI00208FB911|nr:RcpC/CpaB family pilus assembly protein [Pseudarthrobacter sp. MDT3-26]MCO4263370.1 RcpC/CpaB family pilus assembly protein [Pseudarthrobacter sp. MDT3-26]